MDTLIKCVYTGNLDGGPVSIFVGNDDSGRDVAQIEAWNIGKILNVAYDVDDQPQNDLYDNSVDGQYRYFQQFAKVGLIDGYGNIPNHMAVIAAVYMAEQLLTFPIEAISDGGDKVLPPLCNPYPPAGSTKDKQRNLLIHCHTGHSRSVTVAALYIWYKFGVKLKDPNLKSFNCVYENVYNTMTNSEPSSDCTSITDPNGAYEKDDTPTSGMRDAAFRIIQIYATLFPTLTYNQGK